MKYPATQNLERTPLSENIRHYTSDELRIIFRRLNPYLLQKWMDHFIRKEEYEVCGIIKEVMKDSKV
ncbi:MAG TPA: hypothetical protein PL009_02670 [Flavipsychrobacter sp.]|nr:hypothetical protein [Flavipsychrobacter sp.]